MGRHAQPRSTVRSTRHWPVLVLGSLVVAALIAGLLTWRLAGSDDTVTAAAGCDAPQQVRVDVAPSLGPVAESLLAGAVPCTEVTVVARQPLQTLADLGALEPSALPDVWVPDSSLWAARAGPTALTDAGSIAASPVVLVTSRAAVDELDWDERPPTWAEALGTGRPLAVPDLAASAEGLLALAAVQASLGGGVQAENAVVAAVLAAARDAVPSVDAAVAAARSGSVDAPLVPLSEQQLLALDAGPELVAVYPRDGSPSLDHPVLRVGAPAEGDRAAAVDAVVARLTSDQASDAARAAAFRGPTGTAPIGAAVPAALPDAPALDPARVQALLARLTSLAQPSRVLAVIDVSASMEAAAGRGTRATLARDAAQSALALFPGSSALGLWVFAADRQELVPTRALDDDVAGRSQRDVLADELATVPDRLTSGGTALYDTTIAAVRAARDGYDPAAVNSVVVITDGRNEDAAGLQLPGLLAALRTEADPQRPVKVIGVALGPDADLGTLQQIADATGGAAYAAVDPQDLQTVLFDALRRRS